MSNAAQRIQSLLDADSFVEIGGGVTARNTDFNLAATETPSDGVITGYGLICGRLAYVYSQDVSVLNGTVGDAWKIIYRRMKGEWWMLRFWLLSLLHLRAEFIQCQLFCVSVFVLS